MRNIEQKAMESEIEKLRGKNQNLFNALMNAKAKSNTNEKPISQSDENWEAMPQRLRGCGDWLLQRGRIKDAELMFDAAIEIEWLRTQKLRRKEIKKGKR